jgi:hypothetical protein
VTDPTREFPGYGGKADPVTRADFLQNGRNVVEHGNTSEVLPVFEPK